VNNGQRDTCEEEKKEKEVKRGKDGRQGWRD